MIAAAADCVEPAVYRHRARDVTRQTPSVHVT